MGRLHGCWLRCAPPLALATHWVPPGEALIMTELAANYADYANGGAKKESLMRPHSRNRRNSRLILFNSNTPESSRGRGRRPCNPPSQQVLFDILLWRGASRVSIRSRGRDSCGGNSSFHSGVPDERARTTEWLHRFRPSA